MTNRVGQVVQLCYRPLILLTIERWDAALGHWDARMTTPESDTILPLTEDFLRYCDDQNQEKQADDPV